MAKIDTRSWTSFKLIDLFEIEQSKGDNQLQKSLPGNIPLVSSGKTNNGICGFIDQGDGVSELYIGNLITVDMFGKVFYQNKPFYAVSHGRINILKLKKHNKRSENILLFIVSVLEKSLAGKYSYSHMCSITALKKEKIILPQNSNSEPHWEYMDGLIREQKKKVINEFKSINSIKSISCIVDIGSWNFFRLDSLFDIKKGSRLTKANMIPGDINFIGASAINNGVTHHIGNTEKLHSPNTITVNYNGSIGKAFYQTEQFWASDDVNVFYPKFDLNENIAMFLIPLIEKKGQDFCFNNKWVLDDMKKSEIPLPVNELGKIDWNRIENYVKNNLDKSKKRIQGIKSAI